MGLFSDLGEGLKSGTKKFGKGFVQSAKDDPFKFLLTGGASAQLDAVGTLLSSDGSPAPEAEAASLDNTTLLANQKKKQQAKLAGQRSTLLTESTLLLNPRLGNSSGNPTFTSIL